MNRGCARRVEFQVTQILQSYDLKCFRSAFVLCNQSAAFQRMLQAEIKTAEEEDEEEATANEICMPLRRFQEH